MRNTIADVLRRLKARWPGRSRTPGVGLLASLEGVALIAFHLATSPFVGRSRLRWGTEGTEAVDPLPGDEHVPEPKWAYTWAIDIDAGPSAVWPWVAQVGQGRGGFYTYQSLENLVGCRITNTTRILDEHQDITVGDGIRLFADGPALNVETVDPPHALVLYGSPTEAEPGAWWGTSTWQFVIKPEPAGGSRFLTRGRYDHSPDWKGRAVFGRFPLEAISFVMSRKMMKEIKRLSEG